MDKANAEALFERARIYSRISHPKEIPWAERTTPETFRNMKSRRFLMEYCWVVYASGFRVSVLEPIFPNLRRAFKNFDLQALSRMHSISAPLAVFKNEKKATCYLAGCHLIAREGFPRFKARVRATGIDALQSLPGVGTITKFHLAKNIGLADVAKPDIWLVRAAAACATDVVTLVDFLSLSTGFSRHVVDVILWRYGADGKFAEEMRDRKGLTALSMKGGILE